MSEAELAEFRAPAALLAGIIPAESFYLLYGDPEAGKTFLALDIALSAQVGITDWCGRAMMPGHAVYNSAEGRSGISSRIEAWKDARGVTQPSGLTIVPDPICLPDAGSVGAFLQGVARLPQAPSIIVIDTLARSMVGFNENDTSDMGAAIGAIDRIRAETGATVLLIHHPNRAGTERGNTALRGAADGIAKLSTEDSLRVLRCEKSKDLAPFEPISFRLRPHSSSAVLTPTGSIGAIGAMIPASELQTLRLLRDASLDEGLTSTQWESVAKCASSTFFLHRKTLVERRLVVQDRPGRGAHYRLTESGEELLAPKLR